MLIHKNKNCPNESFQNKAYKTKVRLSEKDKIRTFLIKEWIKGRRHQRQIYRKIQPSKPKIKKRDNILHPWLRPSRKADAPPHFQQMLRPRGGGPVPAQIQLRLMQFRRRPRVWGQRARRRTSDNKATTALAVGVSQATNHGVTPFRRSKTERIQASGVR